MLSMLTSRLLSSKASAEGANLVEYMLIALLVAVAAIVALRLLGFEIVGVIDDIVDNLSRRS